MNITRVKQLNYTQRVWKFILDDRKFLYVTNRKRKYTEVYNIDDGEKIYHIMDKYLPLNPHNKERDIRRFFALMLLQ